MLISAMACSGESGNNGATDGADAGGSANAGTGGAVNSGGAVSSGGSTITGSSGGQVGATVPRGICPIDTQVGRFSVEAQVDFGVVQGTVSDAVVPTEIPDQVSEQGQCKVLRRRNLICTPACVGATTCGESGTCIAFPRQLSVGNVTITGLTKATDMAPREPGNNYFMPDADNPPFVAGSAIVLNAAGAEGRRGFQLFGTGSAPIGSKPTWTLDKGKELALEWAKDPADHGTKVAVELTVDQHGMSPLSLACEFDDTGTATIPAGVIDQLLNSGVSGFPNGRIFRRTADHVDTETGCVEFLVGSPIAASVSVVGHIPCKKAADCPTGKTCNLTLERCE